MSPLSKKLAVYDVTGTRSKIASSHTLIERIGRRDLGTDFYF